MIVIRIVQSYNDRCMIIAIVYITTTNLTSNKTNTITITILPIHSTLPFYQIHSTYIQYNSLLPLFQHTTLPFYQYTTLPLYQYTLIHTIPFSITILPIQLFITILPIHSTYIQYHTIMLSSCCHHA